MSFPQEGPFRVGTTMDKAMRAAEEGLGKPFDVTRTSALAQEEARSRARRRGDAPALLELALDPGNLRVSEAKWSDPPWRVLFEWGVDSAEGWRSFLEDGIVPLPSDERDWETSLDIVGWARHEGYVPPEAIEVVPLPGPPR